METNQPPAPHDKADPLYSGRKHYPELDGLRAFAILGVIGLHFCACIPESQIAAAGRPVELITRMFSHGAWGVDLFFVLSGYLITGILLSSKGQAHYFRNFYARRTLRIFPLYYGTLLAILVILPLVLGRVPQMISAAYHHQVWLWTYTTNIYSASHGGGPFGNFFHFWTLAIEEQFYLVWPLIVFLLPPRWLLRLAVAGVVAINLARLAFITVQWMPGTGWNPFVIYNGLASFTLFRADSLLIGGALAVLQANGQLMEWRQFCGWAFAALAVVVSIYLIFIPAYIYGLPTAVICHVTLAPLLFGSALGYVLTCKPASILSRSLSNRFLRSIGKYSYAMYVFHYIYLSLEIRWLPYSLFSKILHNALLGLLTYYASAVAIAFALAFISYHLYEKHFLKLKNFFPEKSRDPTIASGQAIGAPTN